MDNNRVFFQCIQRAIQWSLFFFFIFLTGSLVGYAQSDIIVTHSNGREFLIAGAPTVIAWTGIPMTDTVKIAFSVDAGNTWQQITDKASGHRYTWTVPHTVSSSCLIQIQHATDSLQLSHTLTGHTAGILHAAWNYDGSKLATASVDRTTKIWNTTTGELLSTLQGHTQSIQYLEWSPDGSRIATASLDKTAKIWDTHTGELLYALDRHTASVNRLAWNPDGSKLTTVGGDGLAIIWNTSTGTVQSLLYGHKARVLNVTWSPNGSRIATVSSDGTAKIWQADTGELIQTLSGHTGDVYTARWSFDGSVIATAGLFPYINIWDAATGELLHTLQNQNSQPANTSHMQWHPNKLHLAVGKSNGIGEVWDVQNSQLLHTLSGHSAYIRNIRWNHNGSYIATASADTTLRIWDVQTGAPIQILRGHADYIEHTSWSPNQELFETASADGTAKIWNVVYQSDISDTTFSILELTSPQGVMINVKAYMQGYWNGVAHIPSPVAVELRSGVTLINSSLVGRTTGMLSTTGTITAGFVGVPSGNYWIVVRHGGYLPIGSASAVSMTSGSTTYYDFTDEASKAADGGTIPVSIGGTVYYMLKSGDFNGDGAANPLDVPIFLYGYSKTNAVSTPAQ